MSSDLSNDVRASVRASVRTRITAVMRLELLVQRREPLTLLYMLVLALLAMAFAATGPVELVRGRGTVPRDAGWSLMLASTALTAFGQVITTMVAATVVLRDRADRVYELLASTPMTAREYRIGKLFAALLMLCQIYAAIPLGLIAGAVLGGGDVVAAVTGSLRPFLLLVLPTMLAVGMLQFAVGILSGRLWVIVGLGLVLIWLWSAAVDAVAVSSSPRLAMLLDPFGSAPLLHATATWTDAQRVAQPMPISAELLLSRGCWLSGAAACAWLAIIRLPRALQPARLARALQPALLARASYSAALMIAPQTHRAQPVQAKPALARGNRAGAWRGSVATAAYVARWMLRDPGWRVLTVLGAVNVGVHAVLDAPQHASTGAATEHALQMLGTHSRLFLILLATIYAGELVWREREERSAALFDVLPIGTVAMVAGRIAGVLAAQVAVLLLLGVTALVCAMLSEGAVIDARRFVDVAFWQVAVPFAVWMLIALSVHVLVQQKLVAHLLLIAGWVLVVLLSDGATATWDASIPRAVWAVVAIVAMTVSGLGWTRGARRTASGRGRFTV